MKEIPYVGRGQSEIAREFEQRLQKLPSDAGIIFISVSGEPINGGETINYNILLGLQRYLSEAVGLSLIQQIFAEEIKKGTKFNIQVYLGVGIYEN